ncbi:MAG: hypothetical protein JXR70_19790 [Spirochaetales bacterium]|nr:hypothetical protein [Spirochaetales bacterium]
MDQKKTYRVSQIKLPFNHGPEALEKAIALKLKPLKLKILSVKIVKKSIDARKNEVHVVYSADVLTQANEGFLQIPDGLKDIIEHKEEAYVFPITKKASASKRPLVVGTGPAGLFSALVLAENGFNPIILERGDKIEERKKKIALFWDTGELDINSNMQFGEGGAGTFSDGKLSTGVKDKQGRIKKILTSFVEAGAPEEILISNKAHIGTDYLEIAVKNIRRKIEALGGEFHFNSCLTDLQIEKDSLTGVEVNSSTFIETSALVLAIGHSARDTYLRLHQRGIAMVPKVFSVGLRIEHPQKLIDQAQYGSAISKNKLPPSDYKLAAKTRTGRGVYTFCMCPGGYVVNAASEKNMCVTNGMSYFDRSGLNANAAILVNVYPEDYDKGHIMDGIEFQRDLERRAFLIGGSDYSLPVQRLEDFLHGQETRAFGKISAAAKGRLHFADLNTLFPGFIAQGIKDGIQAFDKKLKGFAKGDALLTGVESRSSSPLRISRDDDYQSSLRGLFPCGEGAGYAGGIMSAALDGIKAAEACAAWLNR